MLAITLLILVLDQIDALALIGNAIFPKNFSRESSVSLMQTNSACSDGLLQSSLHGTNIVEQELLSKEIKWMDEVLAVGGVELLHVKEWEDEDWRQKEGGFSGVDFCHSKQASVRILQYARIPPHSALSEQDPFPRLVGATFFTPRAESHRGLCHGGSFCALMDDAIGWLGFCVTGQVLPWSGYTVQVNTSLKKSVKVGSLLKLESWVNKKEGSRKYWIHARLSDPITHDIHCEANGLFLLNPEHVKNEEVVDGSQQSSH